MQQGWADHGNDPQGVYDRLAEGLALAASPGDLPALAGLIVHVAGEHLGRWADGDALLADLLERLLSELNKNVTCLVKGSRSMGMERVVEAISRRDVAREAG